MNKLGTLWITDIAGVPFYEELENINELHVGQLCYAHSIHYSWLPSKVLSFEKYDPTDESGTTFRDYDNEEEYLHPPLRFLNLKSDEKLFIFKGKKRTVITLCFHKESVLV
ncbi:MAG: hypothetical protein ABDH19_02650 [Thermodesulfovibrio sp.]